MAARSFRVVVLALTCLSITACASFRGQPEPLANPKTQVALVQNEYSRDKVLVNFASPDATKRNGLTPRAYRDLVAYVYLGASEVNYREFKASLSKEMKGSNFGLNLAVLLFNGVAAVSGETGANALAAASATTVGAQNALSKDVFLERTISAVVNTMDAARLTKWTEIRRQLISQDETQFPLGEVLSAIDSMDGVSNIYGALGQIDSKAAEAKAEAEEDAKGLAESQILPRDIQARIVTFTKYVRELPDSEKATLDALADKLGATKDPNNLRKQKNSIIDVFDQKSNAAPGSLDALFASLKPITKRDF